MRWCGDQGVEGGQPLKGVEGRGFDAGVHHPWARPRPRLDPRPCPRWAILAASWGPSRSMCVGMFNAQFMANEITMELIQVNKFRASGDGGN